MAVLVARLVRGMCAGTIGVMCANNARDGLTVGLLLFVGFNITDLLGRWETQEDD
jgi:hypothetical protein